jgi:hypothetical protein
VEGHVLNDRRRAKLRIVFCIEERDSPVQHDEPTGDCSWDVIAEAIREHARDKASHIADDLNHWADLLEGIGELARTTAP